MIRRNLPLTRDDREWLLIPQREHARVSGQLAAAWGGHRADPVISAPDSTNVSLRAAREETLEAIRLHDEGWAEWDAAPGIDARRGRPYGFTEMPPSDAQRIWSESIRRCRQVGPLAAWMVAGHFYALQADVDEDYPQWRAWLEEQQWARRAWLAEWLAADPAHTEAAAEQALFYLQMFDWLSLWLCCRAPVVSDDMGAASEPMTLHEASRGFGPYRFAPSAESLGVVHATPWPFAEGAILVEVAATRVRVAACVAAPALEQTAVDETLTWVLQNQPRRGAVAG